MPPTTLNSEEPYKLRLHAVRLVLACGSVSLGLRVESCGSLTLHICVMHRFDDEK